MSPRGIARLAAGGCEAGEGHLVEFRTLPVRSLLNRSVSRRGLPFRWSINPYRGCEFGCRYCYARYTHEFMEMRDPADFEHKIYIKQQAAWLLRQELRSLKSGEQIALGTATDPYQPIEKRALVTRSILEVMADQHGLRLGIVTKSTLIERDIDLLRQMQPGTSYRCTSPSRHTMPNSPAFSSRAPHVPICASAQFGDCAMRAFEPA